MKKITNVIVLCFITLSVFAKTSDDNLRYQYVHLSVKNHTTYPIDFTVVRSDGIWKNPVSIHTPIRINPDDEYQNTLISIKDINDYESFISTEAAQVGNEHENYVIFAENGSSNYKRLAADIFDGLGKIFVGSTTNYCNATTKEGYADCELVVREKS